MPPDRRRRQTVWLAIPAGFGSEVVIAAALRMRPHSLEDVGASVDKQLPVVLHVGGCRFVPLRHGAPPFFLPFDNPDSESAQMKRARLSASQFSLVSHLRLSSQGRWASREIRCVRSNTSYSARL